MNLLYFIGSYRMFGVLAMLGVLFAISAVCYLPFHPDSISIFVDLLFGFMGCIMTSLTVGTLTANRHIPPICHVSHKHRG